MTLDALGAGLDHLGLLYDTPDDLATILAPHVEEALERGSSVSTYVDRRTARTLREAVGTRADGIVFASPSDIAAPRPENLLRGLRAIAAAATPRRRPLVLTQYSAFCAPGEELTACEAGVNLVLRDLPLTLLCACDHASPLITTARDSHPRWLDAAGVTDNPGFRLPDDRCPTPSTTWGGVHALRLHFGATADLQRIRTHIGALAAETGLRGDEAASAVFAVHEAAVVACDDAEHGATGQASAEPCTLDAWTAGSRLVVEVRGPRAAAPDPCPEGLDPDAALDPRVPRNRLRMVGPLRLVRGFCRDVSDHQVPDGRRIRIVTGS